MFSFALFPLEAHGFFFRPNGVTFTASAGTMEFMRKYQPKEGDIVTFRHRGFLVGSNRPKVPALYRLRTDMTWQDVVDNWKGIGPKTIGKHQNNNNKQKKETTEKRERRDSKIETNKKQ